MATVNPYLTFNDNCEEAFEFYKSVFGGEYQQMARFGDMPPTPGFEISDAAKKKIMHVSLPISKETVLMGSDANPAMGPIIIGQHLSLSVNAESKDAADRIFNSLAAGGRITMPIADTFWGAYFGILIDKFDFIWMVSYDKVNT